MNRLRTLRPGCLALALVLSSCATLSSPSPVGSPAGYSIIQGASSSEVTQFAIQVPKDKGAVYVVIDPGSGARIQPVESHRIARESTPLAVDQVYFSGLRLGVEYRFRMESPQGELLEERKFKTLDTTRRKLRVLIASCMDDAYVEEQKRIWTQALAHKPDLIFMIGDNVYADRYIGPYKGPASPATIWERYHQTRELLEVFHTEELVPVLATWDDHDFGQDDGDKTLEGISESQAIFEAFFPLKPIPGVYERGPGVSSVLKAFGQRFFFMDNRSFRDPSARLGEGASQPKDPARLAKLRSGKEWGVEQERWLFKTLGERAQPTWLINGTQFFGGYGPFESFENDHPENFKDVLKRLSRLPAPVVFVSGDRHLLELMRVPREVLGYETVEMTTSAIHAKVFPETWSVYPNPNQLEGFASIHNYMIVDIEATKRALELAMTGWGPGKQLFSRQIRIERGKKP